MLVSSEQREAIVTLAALAHAIQLPAMRVASGVLGWRDGAKHLELNRRIQNVLRLTVPLVTGFGVALTVANLDSLGSSRLTAGLLVLMTLQVSMLVLRASGDAALAPARARNEITCLLLGLGGIVLLNVREVLSSSVGLGLCWMLFHVYSCRALVQGFYYASVWPHGGWMRISHWGLVTLFSSQAIFYLVSALGVQR